MAIRKNKVEQRCYIRKVQINTREVDGKKQIYGIIPYNSKSQDIYGWEYYEKIAPTAWNKTLADRANVYMFVNHDDSKIVASTKSATMILENQADGLHFTADVPDTTYARDAWAIISGGICDTISFGFIPVKTSLEDDGTHIVNEGQLMEISVCVAFPAYEEASANTSGSDKEDRTMTDEQCEKLITAIKSLELRTSADDKNKTIADADSVSHTEPAAGASQQPTDTKTVPDTTQNEDSEKRECKKKKLLEQIDAVFNEK